MILLLYAYTRALLGVAVAENTTKVVPAQLRRLDGCTLAEQRTKPYLTPHNFRLPQLPSSLLYSI